MNKKSEERRRSAKTRRRREERARQRWESYPQRLLRRIDEDLPFEDMADAVSMEVIRARPDAQDARELFAEIRRMMDRAERLPAVFAAVDAIARLSREIEMLEYALAETLEALEGREICRESQE